MQGRRIPVTDPKDDPYDKVTEPGDYYGPDAGAFSGGIPAVWFLLPIARDPNAPPGARSLHHVQSPPHVFTEQPDGSLTIRESIGAGSSGNYYWHGYLTNGEWHVC